MSHAAALKVVANERGCRKVELSVKQSTACNEKMHGGMPMNLFV